MAGAINCIYQDGMDRFWLASNREGVFCYDGKDLFRFTVDDGLCDNQVLSIQGDKQGAIWLVTSGGISRFDGNGFTTHPADGELRDPGTDELTAGTDDLWFAAGGGAYHYDGNSFSYLLLPKPETNTKYVNITDPSKPDARKLNAYSVYCSLKDKSGNVWLGTQTLGVCCFDGKSFTWLQDKGLAGPAVRAVFQDSKGGYWFGNNGNGLFYYDGKTLTNLSIEYGLENPDFIKTGTSKKGTLARVWSINEDRQGNIWIGTCDSGVWRFDGHSFVNYTTSDGLSGNAINTIYKDHNGDLWFGTDGDGVCTFNGVSFSRFL
jgi:ligand-binding sensor domain-containing protein